MSIVFLGSIILLGNIVEKSSTKQISEQFTENIATKIQKEIVDIKLINNISTSSYIVKEIEIPKRIGGNTYTIFGKENLIQVQTHGKNSIIQNYNYTWWDANLTGSTFSSNQKITLNYSSTNHTITFS